MLLKDINPGPDGSYPLSFLSFNGRVYFAANDGNDYALWAQTAPRPAQFELAVDNVQDLEFSSNFTVYNSMVIFNGRTEALGAELWMTDSTVEGTARVKDIYPGSHWRQSARIHRIQRTALLFPLRRPAWTRSCG
ncbi:MAG: hypothetical protein R2818_14540 [Flavobacteriales bacterium]